MKKSLVIALALMLVLAFASSAMAAQALSNGSYLSTTATGVYPAGTNASAPLTGFARVYGPNKFVADGITNYPYEIYLPNEQAPDQYRIHSNYAKNTDACASCHATHTAVGASLLQWYSAYETCMACHDGTLGSATYNVLGGKIGTTATPAFGGMFGTGNGSESNHNVTGSMEIAAAPGGSTVGTETVAGAHGGTNTRWITEFGCESCHTPHGQGGNARILHPDANYAASWAAKAQSYKYFVNSTAGTVYTDPNFQNANLYIIKGYPYAPALATVDMSALTGYKIDNTLGYSRIVDSTTGALAPAGVLSNVYITGAVASLKVKMTITNYLQSTETVKHVYGMNSYCGACHTDYNTAAFMATGSGAEETGVYAQAHRHQMGMQWYSPTAGLKFEGTPNTMSCLTCHVAHGTSQDYWAATLGGTKGADGTLWAALGTDPSYGELAGSSALKRMPNMGTCEACHAKGEGNEGYNVNAGIVGYAQDDNVANAGKPNTYNWDARTADYAAADLGWVGNAKCLGCHEEYVKGWEATTHATSSHTGATGCGRCHNPGNSIMGSVGTFATAAVAGTDAGITCEACHGTGARHVLAPTPKNIFNPGTTSPERQAIECGKCHDMYVNNAADAYGLSAASGMGNATVDVVYTGGTSKVSKARMDRLEGLTGWSIGYRVANDDPAKFAIATQIGTTSTHYGGAWGYADSKHFRGTGTAEAPNGIVSCNTCHDMHNDTHAGLLKFSYEQVCASCHDSSANLVQAVAMPYNAWNRHQLELRDYAHSFKFGNAATVAAVNLTVTNIEFGNSVTGYAYSVSSPINVWNDSNNKDKSLYPGAGRSGGISVKVDAFSDAGKTTPVYNNIQGTWTLTYDPAASGGQTAGTAVEGTDFEFFPETGVIEFSTAYSVSNATAKKFNGTYTLKYTNDAYPSVNATTSYTIAIP